MSPHTYGANTKVRTNDALAVASHCIANDADVAYFVQTYYSNRLALQCWSIVPTMTAASWLMPISSRKFPHAHTHTNTMSGARTKRTHTHTHRRLIDVDELSVVARSSVVIRAASSSTSPSSGSRMQCRIYCGIRAHIAHSLRLCALRFTSGYFMCAAAAAMPECMSLVH